MSIKVMTMVFDRYPEGGNERLLALALADHARDDGSRIWPSVGELSRKTLQHRSTVQRQIARMIERGWLEVVHRATGRPGDTNEYRINVAWIEGGELPETGSKLRPLSDDAEGAGEPPEPVDNLSTRVANDEERGRAVCERGSTAMRPESSGTVIQPIPPLPPVATGGCGQQDRSPGPDPGNPPSQKERLRWRWADKRSGIEERGSQLSVQPWDERALSMGGELFVAYAARVFALHLDTLGIAASPGRLRPMLDATNDWSGVLHRLVAEAETTKRGATP
jgi:hypothetical protein